MFPETLPQSVHSIFLPPINPNGQVFCKLSLRIDLIFIGFVPHKGMQDCFR